MADIELNKAEFTITEAAAALRLSSRTIRRRIKAGDVSAQKQLRGKQDLWVIDGAELARYAQATGQVLTIPADDPGQQAANAEAVSMTKGGVAMVNQGQIAADMDRLRWALAAVTDERDYLRQILENVTKALPAHKEEPPTEEQRPQKSSLGRRAWQWLRGGSQ